MENIGEEWHRSTAERVGRAVAYYRHAAGMTAQQLAEACRTLGAPIHRTTITKIENGRNRFDLGEWLILAAALDVPPMLLLLPDLPDGDVQTLPTVKQSSWDAYRWATGMAASLRRTSGPPSKGAEVMSAVRRRWDLMRKIPSLELQLGGEEDPVLKDARKYELHAVRDEINHLNRLIHGVGGVVKDA